MKWLKITVALFLVTLVKSGPARSEIDADPEPLTLDKIERNADSELIFTLPDVPPQGTKQLRLVVKNGDNEYNFQSGIQEKLSTSYTFQNDLTQFSGYSLDSEILATTTGGDILGFGTKTSFQYPKFPGDLTSTIIDGVEGLSGENLLRVEGDMKKMTIEGGTCVTNNLIQYCSLPKSVIKYAPCDTSNSIPVCDKELKPDSPTAKKDKILTSAVLSHGAGNQATVKLSPTAPNPDILDAILMHLPSTEKKLCNKDQIEKSKCTIEWNDSSKESLQMVIVQTTKDGTGAETWTTESIVIQDRNLIATKLGDDIIEGRWSMLADESIYRLVKTKTDNSDDPETITVDCSNLSIEKLCFGYFPHVELPGTYTLTVAYQTDESQLEFNEKDQIESSPVSFPASSELAILSRHTTRHQNQLMTDVKICFQHLTPAEGRSFSHYEMLIINEKGQWLKHRILEEGEEKEAKEEGLCFTPFTINTKDFDLTEGTKVVVSQRGLDGVTVLASGGSLLF